MLFYLFITLYSEKNKLRIEEFIKTLKINLNNKLIKKIIIYYEVKKENSKLFYHLKKINNRKIKINLIKKRPSFKFIFEEINKKFKNKICIVANGDIYFCYEKGLNLLKNINWNKYFLSLTRYNQYNHIKDYLYKWGNKNDKGKVIYHKNKKLKLFFDDGRSQDSWIFKSPINLTNCNLDLYLGVNHCDMFLNNELSKIKNLKVINPCLDIISIHIHKDWNILKYKKTLFRDKYISNSKYRKIMKKKGYKIKLIPQCYLKDIINLEEENQHLS